MRFPVNVIMARDVRHLFMKHFVSFCNRKSLSVIKNDARNDCHNSLSFEALLIRTARGTAQHLRALLQICAAFLMVTPTQGVTTVADSLPTKKHCFDWPLGSLFFFVVTIRRAEKIYQFCPHVQQPLAVSSNSVSLVMCLSILVAVTTGK